MARVRARYIPQGLTKVIKDDFAKVEIHVDEKEMKAMAFKGKAGKHAWFYGFRTPERMNEYITNYIKQQTESEQGKIDRRNHKKLEAKKVADGMQVGDILTASWGYEQTNVDAYQVIEKKGMTVKLRKIAVTQYEEEESLNALFETKSKYAPGNMCDYCVPVKDAFINDEVITKRITNGWSIKIDYSRYASKWDGRPQYRSWYY